MGLSDGASLQLRGSLNPLPSFAVRIKTRSGCSVLRNINGADVRFIERFNPVTWTAKEDAYYVDAGVTLTNGSATTSVSGLSHLDGQLCQILADGAVEPSQAPSSGALTLADPATKVHVGLGYDSVYEPMRLDMDSILGNSQAHQKVIRELWVRFYKSLGMTYSNGIQDDDLAFRDTDDNMDESPPLFTGEKKSSGMEHLEAIRA